MNLFKNPKLLAAFEEYVRMQNDLLPSEEELSGITFSENFREKMRHVLMRQKRGFYVLFGTAGRRVASITVAVLVAATVTTVSVEALREPVARFFAEVYEKFTQIVFADDTLDQTSFVPRKPFHIPEGFELVSENYTGSSYMLVYTSKNGEQFVFEQLPQNAVTEADTEGVHYTEITINNLIGITYQNKGITNILFADDIYSYQLSGTCLFDDLIQIAESIN